MPDLDRLAILVDSRVDIDAQIETLTQAREQVDLAIREEVGNVKGKWSVPNGLTVAVTWADRVDTAAVATKWAYDERPELYDEPAPRISLAKVKAHVAPADLEAFTVPTKPSVKVS